MNRILIALLISTLFIACKESVIPFEDDGTSIWFDISKKPFYHSVASGDPLSDKVIIWTRVTPENKQSVEVVWNMATDEGMKNIVQSGKIQTDSTSDYTVKVDVGNLNADSYYYYQFEALGAKSEIGRTKTAAENEETAVKFAVVSCSNFEAGYFNAYGRIAERELDAVLHLGDYIYEYEIDRYGDTTLGRLNIPPGELFTLSDYRTRYALYRLDEDLQEVHRLHPFITIWDDHEITNNAFIHGAQNHQEGEGDYEERKAAAKQTYYEWLPIREGEKLYRSFQFGNLVDLIMLDERLAGRTAPADSIDQMDFMDSTRTMLGIEQREWFLDNLSKSKATWKVIGNQVIFSGVDMAHVRKSVVNLDAWDGYPYEQQLIKEFLHNQKIENTIFVTGDTHSSWAFETPLTYEAYAEKGSEATLAVEFGTTSISSPTQGTNRPKELVMEAEKAMMDKNPHIKYANFRNNGYVVLTLTDSVATAEWYYVETVKAASKDEFLGNIARVNKGSTKLY